ncbi:hypothetical protein M885DRAFT_526887 [Pelagophyceae sp. CCMP2097]|nr:hypothetical protein M885DRAFT_526887 [Pelagophyceae sp. CCMP2097]
MDVAWGRASSFLDQVRACALEACCISARDGVRAHKINLVFPKDRGMSVWYGEVSTPHRLQAEAPEILRRYTGTEECDARHLDRDSARDLLHELVHEKSSLRHMLLPDRHASMERKYVEEIRGVFCLPALTEAEDALAKAGLVYGAFGRGSTVPERLYTHCTFGPLDQDFTNKGQQQNFRVDVETPGGTKLRVQWQQRGVGVCEVSLQEAFWRKYPDFAEAEEDEFPIDHPKYLKFERKYFAAIEKEANDRFVHEPFEMMMVGAISDCTEAWCRVELVERGTEWEKDEATGALTWTPEPWGDDSDDSDDSDGECDGGGGDDDDAPPAQGT